VAKKFLVISAHQQFREPGRGPLAEGGAAGRADAVADSQYGVKVVVLYHAGNLPDAFGLNY
jgi:hypothetical protein